jgi:hypothetical protein
MKCLLAAMPTAVIGMSILLGGCAPSIKVARFDDVNRPPKLGDLDVFSSPQAVTRPYKEIALITAEEGLSSDSTGTRPTASARET